MAFIDQVFFYTPIILILAAFTAMMWADSNNPFQIFISLPTLFVPALDFPQLR